MSFFFNISLFSNFTSPWAGRYKFVGVLRGHKEAVNAVAITANGKHLASGGKLFTFRALMP
jgi:WD40 repeat protein